MENLPLFLSQSEQRAFLLPSVSSSSLDARLLNFQSTLVSCPGAKIKATGQVSANIKCLNNNQLQIVTDHPSQGPDRIVDLDELECSRSIRERIQNTDDPCGPGGQGRYAHIGWYPETRRGSPFHRQISVCHDRSREHTYFANHTVYGSAIDARNIERDRPGFKEGPFYDKSEADDSYKLRNQKETLKLHLGNDQGQKVFNQRESLFLSRGHLSPDADFIYKEWQDATYYFANVAPQWQAFNNGNWKYIEQAVRKFAQGADSRIDVYTGTLGQLKLPADDGSQKKIFLGRETTEENADTPVRYANPDDFTLIPVPEFYWKIAHDPVADRAIVFIGLNNPFFEGDPEREATICPDICAEAKWFFLNQKDVGKGYSYCCSYFDFKGVIDWVPDLGAPEVLENRIVF